MSLENDRTNMNVTSNFGSHNSSHKVSSSRGRKKSSSAFKVSKGGETRPGKKKTMINQTKAQVKTKIKSKIDLSFQKEKYHHSSNSLKNENEINNESKVSIEGLTKKGNTSKKIFKGKVRNQSFTQKKEQQTDGRSTNQKISYNDTTNHDDSITQKQVKSKFDLTDTENNIRNLKLSDEECRNNSPGVIQKNNKKKSKKKFQNSNQKESIHADVAQSRKELYEGDDSRPDENKVAELSADVLEKNLSQLNQKNTGTHSRKKRFFHKGHQNEFVGNSIHKTDIEKNNIDFNQENSTQSPSAAATSQKRDEKMKKNHRKKNKSRKGPTLLEECHSAFSCHDDVVVSKKFMDVTEKRTDNIVKLDRNSKSTQMKRTEVHEKENVIENKKYPVKQNLITCKNIHQESLSAKDAEKSKSKRKKGYKRNNNSEENNLTTRGKAIIRCASPTSAKISRNEDHAFPNLNVQVIDVASDMLEKKSLDDQYDPSKHTKNDIVTTNAAGAEILYRLAYGCNKGCSTESTSSVTSCAEIMSSPEEIINCDDTNDAGFSSPFDYVSAHQYTGIDTSTQITKSVTSENQSYTNTYFTDTKMPMYKAIPTQENIIYNQGNSLPLYDSAPTHYHYPSTMHPLYPMNPYIIQYQQTCIGGTMFFTPTVTTADPDINTAHYSGYDTTNMCLYATQNQMVQSDQINYLEVVPNGEKDVTLLNSSPVHSETVNFQTDIPSE